MHSFSPVNGVGWPNLGPFGSGLGPCGPKPKKWPYPGLNRPNGDSEGTFSPCHPSPLGVSAPKYTARRGFCPQGAELAAFKDVVARMCPPKIVPKWVQNRWKMIFSLQK